MRMRCHPGRRPSLPTAVAGLRSISWIRPPPRSASPSTPRRSVISGSRASGSRSGSIAGQLRQPHGIRRQHRTVLIGNRIGTALRTTDEAVVAQSDGSVKWNYKGQAAARPMSWPQEFADNAWHHLLAIHDRTAGSPFLSMAPRLATGMIGGQGSVETGFPVSVGGDATGSYRYRGDLDEVAFWTRAITTEEASLVYQNGMRNISVTGSDLPGGRRSSTVLAVEQEFPFGLPGRPGDAVAMGLSVGVRLRAPIQPSRDPPHPPRDSNRPWQSTPAGRRVLLPAAACANRSQPSPEINTGWATPGKR